MAQKFHHDIEMCLFLYVHISFCWPTEQRLYFALLIVINNNNYESCFWLSSEFGEDPTIWQFQQSLQVLLHRLILLLWLQLRAAAPPHSCPLYCVTVASYEMHASGNLIPTFAEFFQATGVNLRLPVCLFTRLSVYPSLLPWRRRRPVRANWIWPSDSCLE